MKKLFKILTGSQSGSTTTTSLLILSGVAATTAAITDLNRRLRQSNDSKEQTSILRRSNEAAIANVSQLVNVGALHFNDRCGRLEPSTAISEYDLADGCGEVKNKNERDAINCASNDEEQRRWLYTWDTASKTAVVQTCSRIELPLRIVNSQDLMRQDPSCAVRDGKFIRCNQRVNVTILNFDRQSGQDGQERRFAVVKAQPNGRNTQGSFFASLNGRISLGILSGNVGLVSRHGASDTCYFMRPIAQKETRGSTTNFAFRARSSNGAMTINDIEPRPHGPNADEFQGEYDMEAKVEDYVVLKELREQLLEKLYRPATGYRGSRPESESWNDSNANAFNPQNGGRAQYIASVIQEQDFVNQQTTAFLGVQPQIPNGPQFQYFLASNPDNPSQHYQHVKTWNTGYLRHYKAGCGSSAGDGAADFCTRVDVPLKRYTASAGSKCRSVNKTVSPGNEVREEGKQPVITRKIYYADRAIQTSCDKDWVKRVEEVVAAHEAKYQNIETNGNFDHEITAAMVVSALEVDDNFLKGGGRWASNPLRQAYFDFVPDAAKADGATLLDAYTIAFESPQRRVEEITYVDKQVPGDKEGTFKTVTETKTQVTEGKPITVNISQIESVNSKALEVASHESNSCAYFKYYKPTDAKGCSIKYVTRKNSQTFVCRNNDGCFDSQTKIRMADGSDRLITDLDKGEFVFNPVTQKPAKIVKLTIGPENKPLLNISVGQSTVRVTDSHPFMTKRGWTAARDLRKGELVLTSQGQFTAVTGINLGAAGRIVVNLALEGPANEFEKHYVLADGVVTGDLVIQNMLEATANSGEGFKR